MRASPKKDNNGHKNNSENHSMKQEYPARQAMHLGKNVHRTFSIPSASRQRTVENQNGGITK